MLPPEYQTKELTARLGRYHYPLGRVPKMEEKNDKSVEETIVEILARNPDSRYVKGIPILLAKNHVDYGKLSRLADSEGVVNQLGYVLETTQKLFQKNFVTCNDDNLGKAVEQLWKMRSPEPQFLDRGWEGNKGYLKLISTKADYLVLKDKWGVVTLFEFNDFKRNFELYK